jgi:hypothetical protein
MEEVMRCNVLTSAVYSSTFLPVFWRGVPFCQCFGEEITAFGRTTSSRRGKQSRVYCILQTGIHKQTVRYDVGTGRLFRRGRPFR